PGEGRGVDRPCGARAGEDRGGRRRGAYASRHTPGLSAPILSCLCRFPVTAGRSFRETRSVREYLFMALIAAAVTYLLVPLVRRFAIRIGAAPEIRERDVHTTPTPRLGGLAMYGGLVVGLLVAAQLTK